MADTIQEVLQAFAKGELVVVTDDDDREGEGDLIVAEAPGLFSTMTLTLSCFSRSSAYLRLIGSVEPPGA